MAAQQLHSTPPPEGECQPGEPRCHRAMLPTPTGGRCHDHVLVLRAGSHQDRQLCCWRRPGWE
eukprot:10325996-Alexandrium_andersonii.AAC.1